jgi:hypothetical protein
MRARERAAGTVARVLDAPTDFSQFAIGFDPRDRSRLHELWDDVDEGRPRPFRGVIREQLDQTSASDRTDEAPHEDGRQLAAVSAHRDSHS